jgi:hypothetical protein
MKKLHFYVLLTFCLMSSFGFAQVPVMNPITGASVVCSAPGAATIYSATASNSPTSYSWTVLPSAGVIINPTGISGASISFPYSNGTYTVYCYATNQFGSSAPVSFVVNVFETPTVTFSGANMFCQGSSTNLQASTTILAASATISYSWAPSAYLSNNTGANVTAYPPVPTVYTVTGTVNNCSNTSTILVSPTGPTLACTIQNNPACFGQTVVVNVIGAVTYTFMNGIQNGVPFTATMNPMAILVTGADSNGCKDTLLTSVTVYPPPSFNVSSSHVVLCEGTSAELYAGGTASSYTANGVTMTQTGVGSASLSISPTVTTTYTVTGAFNAGCSTTHTFVQYVANCIGIKEYERENNSLTVYPNPSNGSFMMRSLQNETAIIVNELGSVVKRLELVSGKEEKIELPDGIYFITTPSSRSKIVIIR